MKRGLEAAEHLSGLFCRLICEIIEFPLNAGSQLRRIAKRWIETGRQDAVDELAVAESHLVVFTDGDDAYTVVDIHPIGTERTELAAI